MKWDVLVIGHFLAKYQHGQHPPSYNVNYCETCRALPCKRVDCGTLKCENAPICEKVAKCEQNSMLNVKIDAICEKITLNVKK